jgi:hypothetical protein
MSDAPIQRKITISEGRTRLKAASFSPGPNTGQRYEVWLNRYEFTVSVSYYGRGNSSRLKFQLASAYIAWRTQQLQYIGSRKTPLAP